MTICERRGSPTRLTPTPGSPGFGADEDSSTGTRRERRCATRPCSPAFARSPFLRRGSMCGSADPRAVTCKRRVVTRAGASSSAITRVGRVVKQSQELPGQELFAYIDDSGEQHTVSSQDVNDYLQETTGADYTAKDFRTWAGTVLAAVALRELEGFESDAEAKRNVVKAIDRVARRLGNTRAVARRSYVHPAVLDSYFDGSLGRALARRAEKLLEGGAITPAVEEAVRSILRRRLRTESHGDA